MLQVTLGIFFLISRVLGDGEESADKTPTAKSRSADSPKALRVLCQVQIINRVNFFVPATLAYRLLPLTLDVSLSYASHHIFLPCECTDIRLKLWLGASRSDATSVDN